MKQKLPSLTTCSRASLFRRLALLGVLALGSAMPAAAAIVVTLPTVSTAGSIVITADINYTITSPGVVNLLIMDEWVTSDGNLNYFGAGSLSDISLSYSINAGSPQNVTLNYFTDNFNAAVQAVSANDGYFSLISGVTVAVNDVVTLRAATYNLPVGSVPAGFNPQAAQSFTGNTFLVNPSGVKLSADTPAGAVPEPSQLVLLTGALLPLALRRRRK